MHSLTVCSQFKILFFFFSHVQNQQSAPLSRMLHIGVKSIRLDQFHHLSCAVSSTACSRTETNKQRWSLYRDLLIEHEG